MTLQTKMMLGKVIVATTKKVCTVNVPYFFFDTYVKAHYKHRAEFETFDENEKCQPGDWVIIEELPERMSLKVNHRIKKTVFTNGNIIDPLTGKKCVFTDFAEDLDEEAKLFGGLGFTELRRIGLEQLKSKKLAAEAQ